MCDFDITPEEVYFIFYNKKGICKICGSKTKLISFKDGFRKYCTPSCSFKDKDRTELIRKTSLQIGENGLNSYQRMVDTQRTNSILPDKNGLTRHDRRRITNEKSGLWVPDYKLDDFSLYCRKVEQITNKQCFTNLENFHLRGHANKPGSFHLDHKFSKFEDFKLNIPPYIIGNIVNLEMIEARNNLAKNRKCSIEQEKLFKLFFKQNSHFC